MPPGFAALARAGFDIAVAGFGARGRNAEDDEMAGRAGEVERGANEAAILGDVRDVADRTEGRPSARRRGRARG